MDLRNLGFDGQVSSIRPMQSDSTEPSRAQCDSLLPVAVGSEEQEEPAAEAQVESRPWLTRLLPFALALLAVVAGALAKPMSRKSTESRPVVAGPQSLKTAAGEPYHWGKGQVTVTLDPSLAELCGQGEDAARAAFGAWVATDARLPKLSFERASAKGAVAHDGVNRVMAAPITMQGYERALAVTVQYVDDSTGGILEADIIINTNLKFGCLDDGAPAFDDDHGKKECGGHYDVQNVLTHEVGHFFGLGEDDQLMDATMYVSTPPCETQKRDLAVTDEQAMTQLYANVEYEEDQVGCSAAAHPRAGLPAVGWIVALAGLLRLARSRRRGCKP